MGHVVFFRGANVGGHAAFKPAALAKDLSDLDVVSLGAAGTFVVRTETSGAAVRAAFLERLAIEVDLVVRPASEIARLVARAPFPKSDAQRFVTVLASKPKKLPKLPFDAPATGPWQLRLVAIEGPYALSLRRAKPGKFYPNEVLEKALGVRATTRGWATLEAVAAALDP